MELSSFKARWLRAKTDTVGFRAWKREVAVAIVAGGLTWQFFPEDSALTEAAAIAVVVVAAVLIVPVLEFGWNFYRAPLRIARDHIMDLEEKVSLLEAQGAEEIQFVGERSIKGRWYGNRFIVDNPLLETCSTNKGHKFTWKLDCPPNCLVHISYELHGLADVHFKKVSSQRNIITLAGGGQFEIETDQNSEVAVETTQGQGTIYIRVLGWTKPGKTG